MKTLLNNFYMTIALIFIINSFSTAQNIFPSAGSAGIGTTTPNSSSALDITSTTRGMLVPRMTKTQRDAIVSPATGLLIYQTNNTPGFYYYNGTSWTAISSKGANTSLSNLVTTSINQSLLPSTNNSLSIGSSTLRWKDVNLYNLKFSDGTTQTTAFVPYTPGTGINISGSIITNSAPDQTVLLNNGTGISITGAYPNFTVTSTVAGTQWNTNGSTIYYNGGNVGIGTSTPSQLLDVNGNINVNGSSGYFIGGNKILNTTGFENIFAGAGSGNANTTGYDNAAIGLGALFSNTTGGGNTASGFNALYSNTTGISNTANGWSALYSNTTGIGNSAEGLRALYSNTTGNYNTADGFYSMVENTSGTYNTAEGYSALSYNTTGNNNTAIGTSALIQNTTGSNNVGLGWTALYSNTTGYSNVAIGFRTLAYSQTASNLVGVGDSVLYYNTGANNTAVGSKALFNNTTGLNNSAFGYRALYANTTGFENIADGYGALYSNTTGFYNAASGDGALYSNTTGHYNTACGHTVLYSNTTGYDNTGCGLSVLYSNTTGLYNAGVGTSALYSNTTGNENTATGISALYYNTTGYNNTANGLAASFSNTTGHSNVAIGIDALYFNQATSNLVAVGDSALFSNTSAYNTAVGSKAGYATTSGSYNSFFGYQAAYSNTSGIDNSAYGFQALQSTTTGSYNTAEGVWALKATTGSYNTGIGLYNLYSNISGSDNTSIGALADVNSNNYSNSSAVGYSSSITASNQVRLGNSSVTSIGGYVNWSNISDARVKKNIRDNVPGLAFIDKLQPVTYNLDLDAADRITLKKEVKDQDGNAVKPSQDELNVRSEKEKIVYSGFIAQDVEKAAKSLGYDFSGVDDAKNDHDLYGLRYAEFVVPLVKAVQELSQQDEGLKTKDVRQESKVDSLQFAIGSLQKENTEMKSQIAQLQSSIANIVALSTSASLSVNSVEGQKSSMTNGFAKLQTSNLPETLLGQNIPNPFDNSTLIPFRIPKDCSDASIMITNTSSSEVVSVIPISCNEDHVSIDAGALASGTYSYSLYVDGALIQTKQMAIVR